MMPERWTKTPIKKLCSSIIDCVNKTAPVVDYPTPYKMIRTTNVRHGRVDTEKVKYVEQKVYEQWIRRGTPRLGDIILTREAPVGEVGLLTDDAGVFLGQRTVMYRAHEDKADAKFLLYSLQSSFCQKQIENFSNGGTVAHVRVPDCGEIIINAPPVSEQRKIAKILSTWDEAIATTEQLLANSEQQKKSLIQQLLTGKKRLPRFGATGSGGYGRSNLPEGWSYMPIGEIACEVPARNKERADLPVLSCSKYHGFVDSLKYFNKKVYSDDTSNYKVIRHGEFGFPANHVEEGSIGLQVLYEKGIVSPIYVVFGADGGKVDNFFLYKLLKTDYYRQVFAASTSASVDRRGSLRWKHFSSIKVRLPSLEEQEAISEVIKCAEQETEMIEAKLEKLRTEKKTLMQQLLTGKRRVRVDKYQAEAATA